MLKKYIKCKLNCCKFCKLNKYMLCMLNYTTLYKFKLYNFNRLKI